jgi:hypothetical protein
MRIPLPLHPDEIIQEYQLLTLLHNGFIYIQIDKGMYGLPQAGILANQLLARRIGKHGYFQCRHTPGLWRHTTRPILFTLVVDDFAIQYTGKDQANHLLTLLRRDYEAVSMDWDASLYCGITLKWDYKARTCDLSMPGYVHAALEKFQHATPARPQHSPHRHNPIQYGVKVQLTDTPDRTDRLPPEGIKRIQQIVGTLLYYARAVDNTMLVTLGSLASRQSNATQLTNKDVHQFLDYCATHPAATLRFHASDMRLKIHSDAGYLNESRARSRAGGHFYLGNRDNTPEVSNGAILNPTGILRHVASSASEAEYGALFVNGKEGAVMRNTLHDMGYPQPATIIVTDNSTANGIANDTIKQQRSKAIDMRYHWIRDRIVQKQFCVTWKPGSENKADYYTKHHPGAHHQRMRPQYLHVPAQSNLSQSCEGVLNPDATSSGNKATRPALSIGPTGSGAACAHPALSIGPAGSGVACARQPAQQRYFLRKPFDRLLYLQTLAISH